MTVGFAEPEFDETNLTRRTAHALDLPLEVVTLEATPVVAELDHAIWALDQPSVDGLNSYWISKLAAGAGFKVASPGRAEMNSSVATPHSPGSNVSHGRAMGPPFPC